MLGLGRIGGTQENRSMVKERSIEDEEESLTLHGQVAWTFEAPTSIEAS